MGKPLTIDGRYFPTQSFAVEHAQATLYRDVLGSQVQGADERFVRALFLGRQGKLAELRGREIAKVWRKSNRYGTTCFFIELEDGTLVDFSIRDAIKDIADAQAMWP